MPSSDATPVTTAIETPQVLAVGEIRDSGPAPAAIAAALPAERVIEPVLPSPAIRSTPVALEPILLPPDLELIETDPEKLLIAVNKPEPPQQPRPPHVRPPSPPVSDEPLVQIETRK